MATHTYFLIDLLLSKLAGRLDYAWKTERGKHLVCKCKFDILVTDVPDPNTRPGELADSLRALFEAVLKGSSVRLRRCLPTPSVDWVQEHSVTGSRFSIRCEFDNQFEQVFDRSGITVLTGPEFPLAEKLAFSGKRFASVNCDRFLAALFTALSGLPAAAAAQGIPMTPKQEAMLKELVTLHPWPSVRLPWHMSLLQRCLHGSTQPPSGEPNPTDPSRPSPPA